MKRNLQSIPATKIGKVEELLSTAQFDGIGLLSRELSASFDEALLVDLFNRCIADYPQNEKSKADAWLAPRLHAGLRLSRRAAADTGMWAWLASGVARSYIEWRWPRSDESTWWRYTSGDLLRNGLSRLWWGAEITRSGPDYSVTELAFARVRTFMFVSELRYSWHREAARAFARVLSEEDAHSEKEPDNLSKLFNVYLRTQALELWDAPADQGQLIGPDENWIGAAVTLSELTGPTHLLRGPSTGVSDLQTEERIYVWLRQLLNGLRSN